MPNRRKSVIDGLEEAEPLFYEALAGLPDDIRPLMIYCCVAMARALQHINDRRTVSKDWLEVEVNLHCLAAALLVAFGDHIVKPAFFQLVKKIGDELFDNRRVERAVHAVWNSKFSVRRPRLAQVDCQCGNAD